MKRSLICLIFAFVLMVALPGCAAATCAKDFDFVVEEGHSIRALMASQGCVKYESEPFYVYVNGKEILCDLNTMQELCDKDMARIEQIFDGKLNENSAIGMHWLVLYDQNNTWVAHLRVGRDPFGFFPDLPVAYFDNSGNLISLTSYDINEGYFQYSFLYDDNNRIIYAEERCFEVPLSTGIRSKTFSCYVHDWRYCQDGSYFRLTRVWDRLPNSDPPDNVYIEKYIDGYLLVSKYYDSEELFLADEMLQNEWNEAESKGK